MFWWFEREGVHTRVEVLHTSTGNFELHVVDGDGNEQVEQFKDATELAKRQKEIQDMLISTGWIGPKPWIV